MDWWCQDGERKRRHHHARREQNGPGGEEVSGASQCVTTAHVLWTDVCNDCVGSMEWGWTVVFLQTNYDWGGGAESQRAERHVHRDQCQDRLQCQTGDSCSFATVFTAFWPPLSPCLHTVPARWRSHKIFCVSLNSTSKSTLNLSILSSYCTLKS